MHTHIYGYKSQHTYSTHPWIHKWMDGYMDLHTHTHTLINNRMKFPNYNEVCDSWLGLPVINVNTFPLGNYEHISTL